MNEPILCLVILLCLAWVIYLRLRVEQKKREQAEASAHLDVQVKRGEVTRGMRKFSTDA